MEGIREISEHGQDKINNYSLKNILPSSPPHTTPLIRQLTSRKIHDDQKPVALSAMTKLQVRHRR